MKKRTSYLVTVIGPGVPLIKMPKNLANVRKCIKRFDADRTIIADRYVRSKSGVKLTTVYKQNYCGEPDLNRL